MLKIGITGGIGSGKSTLCLIFEQFGVPVYYADTQARNLMESNIELREQLIAEFGDVIFSENKLQRPLLASIVFNDEEKLSRLNALVHPFVQKDFDHWALEQNTSYVIKEAALMFESGSNKSLDLVVFVKCPLEERIQRVIQRDNLSREEIMKRIRRQWPDARKEQLSDVLVLNDGSCSMIEQANALHQQWIKK